MFWVFKIGFNSAPYPISVSKTHLVLHKPVKWVSRDRRCFQSPPTKFMPEPEYHSWLFVLFFCLLIRVEEIEGLELCEKDKVWFWVWFSLISELLDALFQELKKGFLILLCWNLHWCRDSGNSQIYSHIQRMAIISLFQSKSGSIKCWKKHKQKFIQS